MLTKNAAANAQGGAWEIVKRKGHVRHIAVQSHITAREPRRRKSTRPVDNPSNQ